MIDNPNLPRELTNILPSSVLSEIKNENSDIDLENTALSDEEEITDNLGNNNCISPRDSHLRTIPIRLNSDNFPNNHIHSNTSTNSDINSIYNCSNDNYYNDNNVFISSNNNNNFCYLNNNNFTFKHHNYFHSIFDLPYNNYNQTTRKKSFNISELHNSPYLSKFNLDPKQSSFKNTKKNSTTSCSNNSNNNTKQTSSDSNTEYYEIDEFKSFIMSLGFPITEYLCTQKGGRDIQKHLNKSSPQCKTILIEMLNDNIHYIMKDVYGNYFCQQFISECNSDQLLSILKLISNNYVSIAKDYSGTHVLQTLLDYITLPEQENIILLSIKEHELELAYDVNGTHVLQKILITIPEDHRENLNTIILNNLKQLALNSSGICLIKKFISVVKSKENENIILKSFTSNCVELSRSPFGNYAIQYVLDLWGAEKCNGLLKKIVDNICLLSLQKYSSNVSEKTVLLVNDKLQQICIKNIFFNNNKLLCLIKNKYSRFVVQKLIKTMNAEQKEHVKKILNSLDINKSKEKNTVDNLLSLLKSDKEK